jgi:chromate reductase
VELFDVSDLPLYNQDDDADVLPDSAARLRAAVAAADGVVIATPEYNHSFSAVAKNFIDWASRPFAAGPLLKKPVMLIAAGPGPSGGIHALEATSTLMTLLGCPIVASIGVAGAHEKINDEGHIVDQDLVQQLRAGLAGFTQ